MTAVPFFVMGGLGVLIADLFEKEMAFFRTASMLRRYGYRMSFGKDTVFRKTIYERRTDG